MNNVKEYYRTDDRKLLLGVFSGMEKYFGLNAYLMRVLFVILCLATNLWVILAYVAVAVLVKSDSGEPLERELRESAEDIKRRFTENAATVERTETVVSETVADPASPDKTEPDTDAEESAPVKDGK